MKSRPFLRTVLLSLALSLLGIVAVILLLGDFSDLKELSRVSVPVLLLTVAMLFVTFVIGGLRLFMLMRLAGERTGLWTSIKAYIMGLFAAALTPSGSGNAPSIALTFQADGVPAARCWSAAIYTSVLDLFFFAYSVPLAAVFLWQLGLMPTVVVWLSILACIISIGLWYGISFRLDRTTGLFYRLFSIRFLRRWRRAAIVFVRELAGAVSSMSAGGLGMHVQLHILSLALHLVTYTILHVFLSALGGDTPWIVTISVLALVTAVSHIVPTPGASGYMEATLAYVFSLRTEPAIVTASVVAYRVLSFYASLLLGMLLGGSLLISEMSRKPAEKEKPAVRPPPA